MMSDLNNTLNSLVCNKRRIPKVLQSQKSSSFLTRKRSHICIILMMSIEKGPELSEDPLLAREQVYSTGSDFDTEPFRSSTSLDEEERERRRSRTTTYATSYCSSFLCLVMVGVVITFVLFVVLLLKDPWQLMAILIILALATTAVLIMCAYRMRVRD